MHMHIHRHVHARVLLNIDIHAHAHIRTHTHADALTHRHTYTDQGIQCMCKFMGFKPGCVMNVSAVILALATDQSFERRSGMNICVRARNMVNNASGGLIQDKL